MALSGCVVEVPIFMHVKLGRLLKLIGLVDVVFVVHVLAGRFLSIHDKNETGVVF